MCIILLKVQQGFLSHFILPLLVYIALGEAVCTIFKNPRTTIARTNETIELSCRVEFNNEMTSVLLTIDNQTLNSNFLEPKEEKYFEKRKISLECIKTSCNVSIAATAENDGLIIQCGFAGCLTEKVVVFVVDEIPAPPCPPVIEVLNMTSLNVSWSLPWPYPVNWYSLFIYNYTGEQNSLRNHTAATTFFVLNNKEGFECAELSFSVQADTDVGLTAISNNTIKKFYKGIHGINVINSTKSYEFQQSKGGVLMSLKVSFKPPPLCPHEILKYTFRLTNHRSNEVLTMISINGSNVEFKFHGNVLLTDELDMTVEISDMEDTVTLRLFTIKYKDTMDFTSPVSTSSLTTISASPSPSGQSTDSATIIIGALAGGGVIIILLAIFTPICSYFYYYRRSATKFKVRSDGMKRGSDQNNFALPNMIVNAQYATAQDEVTYEEIRPLQNEEGYCTISDHDAKTPQLPPPHACGKIKQVIDPSNNTTDRLTSKEYEYIEMGTPPSVDSHKSPRYVFNRTETS